MLSGTITDASGRTLSGQTTEAFLISVGHAPLLSIGLNCALGAKAVDAVFTDLDAKAPFAVSAHPNAGLPNAFGEYDETADQMAAQIKDYLDLNLDQYHWRLLWDFSRSHCGYCSTGKKL